MKFSFLDIDDFCKQPRSLREVEERARTTTVLGQCRLGLPSLSFETCCEIQRLDVEEPTFQKTYCPTNHKPNLSVQRQTLSHTQPPTSTDPRRLSRGGFLNPIGNPQMMPLSSSTKTVFSRSNREQPPNDAKLVMYLQRFAEAS
ncbi:unnamed protein product [Enterobius vermicularis]|uniref:Uncharacterized protein n=1 Tax=Enterobius vermicularis TaxID=51028 RepID=A0A0N4V5J0_ENTVE|nr:unnamed protein product [Enterobius vermicularis]